MSISEDVHKQVLGFLNRHCPNPAVIANAIARHNLLTVQDKRPGEKICIKGEPATACWLILQGQVEIQSDNRNVTFRKVGELIGEQAFLRTLSGKKGGRTADMIACGPVQLACIDAAFQERLSDEEKLVWIKTLADVVNEKLEEATTGRSGLRKSIDDSESLLRRFADGDALGIVKLSADGRGRPAQDRTVIAYFSDIANFSSWASGKDPQVIANLIRRLATIQIDLIRGAGGTIDKLLGDGVMAYWFIDTPERAIDEPKKAIACARALIKAVQAAIKIEGLEAVLDIRVGLHCGPVAFGDFGAADRIAVTILGETVNLAARFEQAKSPDLGALRISPELKTLSEKAGADLSDFRGPIQTAVKHDVTIDIYSALEKLP
jgi:class 3 adenylate cyclase